MATAVAEPPATIIPEPSVKPLDLGKVDAAHAAALKAAPATVAKPGDDPPLKPVNPLVDAFNRAMKPTAPDDEVGKGDDDVIPNGKTAEPAKPDDSVKFTGKKAADWKALHSARDEAVAKATKLEAEFKAINEQLAEAKKQPVIDPKEVEALRTEKQELLDRMEKVALAHDPRFESHFSKIEGDAIKAAKEAVGETNAQAVEDLMQLPPSKARKERLNELLVEMDNEFDKVALAQAVRDMDAARADKNEKLSKSKEYVAQLKAADAAESSKQQAARLKMQENAAEEAVKFAQTLSAFQSIEGAAEHNAAIAARQEKVRRIMMGKMSATELRNMPALAEEAEHLRTTVLPLLLEENKKLRTSVTAMTAANPSLEGGGVQPGSSSKPSGFIDAFTKAMGGK